MSKEITLIMPGLLGLPRRLQGRVSMPALAGLPGFRQFVARAMVQPVSPGRHAFVAGILGADKPALAALAWKSAVSNDSQQAQHTTDMVAFADPMHLQAGTDDLIAVGPQWLDVSPDELEELAVTLNAHFAPELQFSTAGGQMFLHARLLEDVSTTALHDVHARGVRTHLPEGNGAGKLHALLNEIQMLLHDHPVNARRNDRGVMPLNGLWVWGEGSSAIARMPDAPAAPSDCRFIGSSMIFAGLASCTGREIEKVPEQLPDELSGQLCVELTAAAEMLDRDDIAAWEQTVQHYEQNWFAPALEALRAGEVESVQLYAGDACCYRLRRHDLLKFWRRRRPQIRFDD